MFDFLFHNKRSAVRRFMSSRVNRNVLNQMRVGNRDLFRSPFCEVVWLIPCDESGHHIEFEHAYPAVTRDICPAGLSLIQNEPLTAEKVIVGIDGDAGRTFFRCSKEHCTELGHGFHQVGLYLEEIVELKHSDLEVVERSVAEHSHVELATV
jgi:hypothetical protein